MVYPLLLFADPGAPRERVLRLLETAPDLRPDSEVANRYWLTTPEGAAQIDIGSKDPIESIHVEFPAGRPALMEGVTRRVLELAGALEMRVEDAHWGREVTLENLPELREHWRQLGARRPARPTPSSRPWWRFWA